MRIEETELQDIKDLLQQLNGELTPEKQTLWQNLKGKLQFFLKLSELAAQEMRADVDRWDKEKLEQELQAPARGQQGGHERYQHS